MQGINKVILLGNLGKDPELRTINGDTSVVSFPLATTNSYKDKNNERQDVTEWHNIVAWRGMADHMAKILKKGDRIYLEGTIKTRSWESKEGEKRYMTEIVVETFLKINSNANNEQH